MPETKAAFARAGELARQVENAADRFSAYYGQWVAGLTRGDIGLAREMAELFLHEVEVQPNLPEACVGHRIFGTTCWYMGEFARAHDHHKWRRKREAAGMTDMSEGIGYSRAQGIHMCLPMFEAALAEVEAETGKIDASLARMDQAIAEPDQTGERWCQADLHRIRGEILLKRDPANTAPAEEAFFTAIAVAQEQKARNFELRAALSLAKLYQSTNRAADAHAALAPALEGFAPTPEFPEIEEAQALLAALADTDDVKNAAASRQRRLKLQTSYGQAVMLSRGYASEEAKTAFTRASTRVCSRS